MTDGRGMHVRLKHVKPVRKLLASGETVTYYYHRVTGKRILGDPGTGQFLANYEVAGRPVNCVAPDTMAALTLAFRASPEFANLRDRTRQDYEKHLDAIVVKFGAAEIDAFNDARIRKNIMEWRGELAKRSHKQADYAMAVLRLTLQWAYNQGKLEINHATRTGKLYSPDRSDKIWEAVEIEAVQRAAHETIRWAFMLGLDTGQREGDLLALPWSAFDGKAITLRQSKSGRKVYIPCTSELLLTLKRIPRCAVTILTNQDGMAWTESGFRTMFGRTKKRAGIEDKTFHDLRGTFVTRSWERGASLAEIVSVTGHSLKEAQAIIDAYTARTPAMSRSLIRKYQRRTKMETKGGNRV